MEDFKKKKEYHFKEEDEDDEYLKDVQSNSLRRF